MTTALEALLKKPVAEFTALEFAVTRLYGSGDEAGANEAAAELAAQAAELARMKEALRQIDHSTTSWDANRLGDIQLQRKRWQRCGDIARAALSQGAGEGEHICENCGEPMSQHLYGSQKICKNGEWNNWGRDARR